MQTLNSGAPRIVGWREWLALPELGIKRLQCKIDTGARNSALHALDLETFSRSGRPHVRFRLYPMHGNKDTSIPCSAEICDQRHIRSSNGQRERRYVIVTPMILGQVQQEIEITLADRGPMRFGMLLGRQSLIDGGWLVNPALAFVNGRPAMASGQDG
ncbi:ATP-dependent zinc protease [Thioalkalivibrio sp.]|uniref:ATP-dependent zinc protease family protein n=1 Tax=Thioalkalivibrio sp. TaxID=2093813 RepID=UPI003976AADB